MFGNAKPTASLSSGLLARKGQARPAMRPQGFLGFAQAPAADDLGWNDMGEDAAPAPASPAVPPVVQQQEALREEFAAPARPAPAEPLASAAPEPEDAVTAAQEPDAAPALDPAVVAQVAGLAAVQRKGKAAFTLRLDRDRHLRLRLAAAVRHASAQALVTEALDQFLKTLPEVEELARRLSEPNLGDK